MKILSCCYVLCSHVFLHALSSSPNLSMLFGFYLYLHDWAWGCGVLFSSSFGRAGSWDVLNLEPRVSELHGSWLTSGCLQRKARSGCRGSKRRQNLHPDLNARSAFQRDWADFVCIKGAGSAQHPWISEAKIQLPKTKPRQTKPPSQPQSWGCNCCSRGGWSHKLSPGEQAICVLSTLRISQHAHRPAFDSELCCSVLLTFLWWIATRWTCGAHLSSAPARPSQSTLSERSHSFLSFLLSPAVCRLELIRGYSQENLCDGPRGSSPGLSLCSLGSGTAASAVSRLSQPALLSPALEKS